jgi:KUP system potassium uptake protein
MATGKEEKEKGTRNYFLFLCLSALGVVYGDIGTSPLYAFRVCFHGDFAIEPTKANILGVLSLIFWSLVLIISVKYLLLILRADNQGEGGILALMELVLPKKGRQRALILSLGLFGAALLYGDGTITPAISVLSAVEGLEVATPVLQPYIVPITLVILFLLFLIQHRGTRVVGLLFGPVMLLWFLVLAAVGVASISKNTAVFAAVSPYHAFRFFSTQGFHSLYILGAVFLVVTGGEALYADIGHFGRAPIRFSWFTFVLPSLLLNYFGQGALLLENRSFAVNPFYYLTPSWALYPMVLLSTCATVIASQAIISGAFSLTFQALQLGYLPRLKIHHTSAEEKGQIFVPQINWILFAVTASIVLGFKSSGNLAAAYGVAVTTTMVITTCLGFFVMRDLWHWHLLAAVSVAAFFFFIDISYFVANMLKIFQGGWFPLLIGVTVYLLMSTWIKGQQFIRKQRRDYAWPLVRSIKKLDLRTVKRVRGTAIYMTESPLSTPPAFIQNLQHNKVVHNRVIFLYVGVKNVPRVRAEDRVKFRTFAEGFYLTLVRYGFMDRTDVRAAIRILDNKYLRIKLEDTTFFVGSDTFLPSRSIGMSPWRDKIYLFMRRNSERATAYFNLPPDRVFEIGMQIKF